MQYGPSLKRAFTASIVLMGTLVAAPASADIVPCFGGIGTCPPSLSCNDDAECFGQGAGRCVFSSGGGGGGTCSPDCSATFTCTGDADCPSFDPLVANCQPTSTTAVPGVCLYHDPSDRPYVTLCTSTGTPATLAQIRACFAGTSWALGDCDGDGVTNGVDANPCDGTVTSTIPTAPSPFCLPGRVCEGTSNRCAPFLRCNSTDSCVAAAGRVGALGAWECGPVPGTSASFCHPSCDATVHCSGTMDCSFLGSCRLVDATLSMCLPTRMSSCASGCSSNPLDWASGQGDCDGDGAQNGCDPNPCLTGDTPCTFNHICSIDAGVTTIDASVADASTGLTDGGTTTSDAASLEDAASTEDAATVPMDGGNVAMDASAPPQTTPGLGFGGGGGCRCAVAGGRARGDAGAYLGLAIAMIVVARRRRAR